MVFDVTKGTDRSVTATPARCFAYTAPFMSISHFTYSISSFSKKLTSNRTIKVPFPEELSSFMGGKQYVIQYIMGPSKVLVALKHRFEQFTLSCRMCQEEKHELSLTSGGHNMLIIWMNGSPLSSAVWRGGGDSAARAVQQPGHLSPVSAGGLIIHPNDAVYSFH